MEKPDSRQPPADALREVLSRRFGKAKGEQIFEAIRDHAGGRPTKDSTILVIDPKSIDDAAIASDIFGLGSAALLEFDNYITYHRARQQTVLRVMKYYLREEEYRALMPSFTLVSILSDQKAHADPDKQRMISGLFAQLDRLPRGKRIYNHVSDGSFMGSIYPEMRRLETATNPAGRLPPRSPEANRVRKVFYDAIADDPTTLWVRGSMEFEEAFDRIVEALVEKNTPYLRVRGAGNAWSLTKAVCELFVESFPAFTQTVVPQADNPSAGHVRLDRR